MRAITILISLSICSASISMAQITTPKQKPAGTGSIKSIEMWDVYFSVKDGHTTESNRTIKQRITFRPDGNKDEETFYKPDGSITTRMVFTYDASGHVTGHEEYAATLDKTLTAPRRHIFTLDNLGRRIEYRVIEANGEIANRFTYRYDNNGRLIEENNFFGTGQPGGRMRHTYDEKGRLTGDLRYEGDTLVSSFLMKYDSAGDCTETRQYLGDKLSSMTVYISDDKHRVISAETFVEDRAVEKSKDGIVDLPLSHGPKPGKVMTNYDDVTRTKEVLTYDAAGALTQRVVEGFDEHGQQTSSSIFDGAGKGNDTKISFYNGNNLQGTLQGPTINQREYDGRGNLIKTTYLILANAGADPQPVRIEERVITYY